MIMRWVHEMDTWNGYMKWVDGCDFFWWYGGWRWMMRWWWNMMMIWWRTNNVPEHPPKASHYWYIYIYNLFFVYIHTYYIYIHLLYNLYLYIYIEYTYLEPLCPLFWGLNLFFVWVLPGGCNSIDQLTLVICSIEGTKDHAVCKKPLSFLNDWIILLGGNDLLLWRIILVE